MVFENFSESPPEVSATTTRFPRDNESSFSSKNVARQHSERSGRPRCVTNPEIIVKLLKMILEDRQLKVREISKAVGTSS